MLVTVEVEFMFVLDLMRMLMAPFQLCWPTATCGIQLPPHFFFFFQFMPIFSLL